MSRAISLTALYALAMAALVFSYGMAPPVQPTPEAVTIPASGDAG
jgi:hypothetical protein